MSSKKKTVLFVNRKAPFGSSYARESLDAALACAAFDQKVSILFMDDGVFQLQKEQNGSTIGLKGVEASLPALTIYDINNIYVEGYSLQARHIAPENLLIESKVLDNNAIKALFEQHDLILSF